MKRTPVDYDPFATSGLKRTPVDYDPFATEPTAAERQNGRRGLNPDGSRLQPGAGTGQRGVAPEPVVDNEPQVYPNDPEWVKDTRRLVGDVGRTAQGAVIGGTGRAIEGLSKIGQMSQENQSRGLDRQREIEAYVKDAMDWGMSAEDARKTALREVPVDRSAIKFDPNRAAQELTRTGQAQIESASPQFQREVAASGLEGDITDFSTWGVKEGSTVKGMLGQGVRIAGEMAPIVGAAAIPGVGPLLAVGGAAGQSAEGAFEEQSQRILGMSEDELRKVPAYAELLKTLPPDQAREELASRVGQESMIPAATIGAGSGLIPGGRLTSGIRAATTRRLGSNIVGRGVGEAPQAVFEGLTEVGETAGAIAATNRVTGEDRSTTEGSLENLVLGAAGGLPGAVSSSLTPSAADYRREADTLKAERAVASTPEQAGTLDAGIALAEARAGKAEKKGYYELMRERARGSQQAGNGEVPIDDGAVSTGRSYEGSAARSEPVPARAEPRVQQLASLDADGQPTVSNQDAVDEAELDRLLAGAFPDASQTDEDGQGAPILASRVVDPPSDDGIESEELDPSDPMIQRMLAEQQAGMERRDLERREGPSDALTEGFRALAKNPALFRSGMLKAGKDLRTLAPKAGLIYGGMSTDSESGLPFHKIMVDQGRAGQHEARVYTSGGKVWIDVSELESGGGGGDSVYNIAQSMAVNNGQEFIQDPLGLSDKARIRRPFQQTSGILKADSAENFPVGEFLASKPSNGLDTRPIAEDPRRRVNPSLGEHLRTIHYNTTLAVPEVKGIRYDPDLEQFVDKAGEVVTDRDFKRLGDYRRANPIGPAMVGQRDGSGDRSDASPTGRNSLKVAALVETLDGVTDPRAKSALVDKLRSLAAGSDGDSLGVLTGILPSRRVDENGKSDAGRVGGVPQETDGKGASGRLGGVRGDGVSGDSERVANIRKAITQSFPRAKRLLDSGQAKIVQSERDVPDSIRARSKPLSEADGTIQGFYDPKSGTSYLIADNIRSEDSARAVFLHEEGVHAGMKALLGDKFDAISDQLRELEKSGDDRTRKIIAEARMRVKAAETPAIHVNEELIAHTVELAEQSKKKSTGLKAWLADVYAALSAWAARNGFKNLSVEDLRRIAVGAVGHQARVEAKPGAVMPSRKSDNQTQTINVDGKDRSRINSDGEPIADTAEAVRNFWRWFGDSKVVDSRGRPLVVYHNTHTKGIDVFLPKNNENVRDAATVEKYRADAAENKPIGYMLFRNGIFFTPSKTEYVGYGPEQYAAYIKALHPVIHAGRNNVRGENPEMRRDALFIENDGKLDEIAVLLPEQIKAVDGNSGAFDPSNPSILASRVTPEDRIAEQFREASDKRTEAASQLGVNGPSLTWELDAGRFSDGWKGKLREMRASLQDKYLSVMGAQGDIEKASGQLIADSQNVYRRENLMHGRTASQIESLHDDYVTPTKRMMKKNKVPVEAVEDYLEARAAEDRNKHIASINPKMPDGGSGMLTQEAKDYLAGKENGHRSKATLTPEMKSKVEAIVARLDKVRDETLTRLKDSGQITDAQYSELSKNANYAPLRGKDGDDIGHKAVGGGIDVRGKVFQRAMGRGEGNRAVNIIAEMIGDAERSIVQAEKTRVGQTLVRLVLANPNKDVWEVEPVQIERKYSESQDVVYEAIKAIDNDPGAVRVMIKGKPYRVVLKDPQMAKAIKNLGADQINVVFRFLGAVNRYFSAVMTRYNPAFVPINMIRDMGMGIIGITAEHGLRAGKDATVNYLPAMRALWREARGKSITSQAGRYSKEYAEAGGRTGFQKYENVEEIAETLSDEFKGFFQMVREGKPMSYVARQIKESKAVQFIEDANDTIENSMRLAAFIARRKKGASVESAAEYAKNVTVNFNRRGHSTGIANSLFLFFNAATQGSTRTFQLLKNRKVQATLGAMAGLQFLLAFAAMGADDEDDDGLTAWEKIPDHEKLRNFIIPIVGERDGKMTVKLVKIPMPYGFNFFTYAGGRLAQAMKGTQETDVAKLTNDLGTAAVDAVSPLKFTDGMQGLKPYLMKVFDSLGYNKNDFGGDITSERPYSDYEVPRSSLGRASTPEPYHKAAEALNRFGGGDAFTPPKIMANLLDRSPEDLKFLTEAFGGGILRTANQAFGAGQKLYAGVDLSANDVPIIKSLFSEVDMERSTQASYYETMDRIAREKARVRDVYAKEGKDAAQAKIDSTPELEGIKLHRFKTGKYEDKSGSIQLDAKPKSLYYTTKKVEKDLREVTEKITAVRANTALSAADRIKQLESLDQEREKIQRQLNIKWKETK